MGCGGSRMGGAGGDDLSSRIRPLLIQRLEEMKKHRHASVLKGNPTLSKKELLRHNGHDGDEMEHDKSMISAKFAHVPDNNVVCNKEVVHEKVIKVVKEQEVHDNDVSHYDYCHEEEDEEENEERMSNYDGRMICPGSPSFRVYCIDLSDDDEDKDGEEKRSQTENGTIVLVDPKDPNIIKRVKKARKGRKFGIALPKATMPKKYLLNVTAPCYTVAARGCMGNHHSRLLQDKSSSN